MNAAALVVLRPVDGAPRVAHVLVVADVEDPAADGQPEHDEDVLDELGLNFISNLNVFVKFCTLSRITHPYAKQNRSKIGTNILRILTVEGRITVLLVYCLARLDLTKE